MSELEHQHGMRLPSVEEIARLPPDGGEAFNRLIHSSSPYLLQHARNPVDWYPWGEEAFQRAREEDKPVFLSIGYSSCHWCHVMEHESFEAPDVAGLLNETMVCVKVDREERPDIDHVYMQVCQMLTGSGGWPLTVIMTPERKPFFAGTYFPRKASYGRMGMLELVPRISEAWRERREAVMGSVDSILEGLNSTPSTSGEEMGPLSLDAAYRQLNRRFDPSRGGFGQAPKFPTPHNLMFLLRHWKRTGAGDALDMVERTLDGMQRGGIHDHVGGGFHRYSTDRNWLVPHFEKMLYDQALISMAYTEVYQITGNLHYRETAEQVFEYVLRDMTHPDGGFFSAEDADSEGQEGKFYTWTETELGAVLGSDAELAFRLFNTDPKGNFRDEASGITTGSNILHLSPEHELPAGEEALRLKVIRKRLLEVRSRRVRPMRDDKILADWNGLMIASLAKAGRVFNDAALTRASEKAAGFVLDCMTGEGRLLHRYRNGKAGIAGHLDDYAFMVWGLIELYQTTFTPEYLHHALELNRRMFDEFRDIQSGALFITADDSEPLITRPMETWDGAVPGGNSVAMMNALRLAAITGDNELREMAYSIGSALAGSAKGAEASHTMLLCAVDLAVNGTREIVVTGESEAEDTGLLIDAARAGFNPATVVILRSLEESDPIIRLLPGLASLTAVDGKATVYVCSGGHCLPPITDPAGLDPSDDAG